MPDTDGVAVLLGGIGMMAVGYRVRFGTAPKLLEIYTNEKLPGHLRNAAFFALSDGLGFALGGIAMVIALPGPLAAALIVPATVLVLMSLVWMSRPPDILKPMWLRRMEGEGLAGPAADRFDVAFLWASRALIALVGGLFVALSLNYLAH